MSTVQVLCPNGRRQNVKVTPNTKLLQVLEEVCKKQGFLPPEDYSLKHGRKTVDVTLSIRYSNLPNNVKLELVKSESSRAEQDVLIALQLEDGQRLQQTFSPATSLWDILQHWEKADSAHTGNLCKMDPSHTPPIQTTCIYMREEVIGEVALQTMTLRKLGLTSGKAVIRLVHRPVDDTVMAEILDKIDREKTKLEKLDSLAQRQLPQQEDKSLPPKAEELIDRSEEKSQSTEDKSEISTESTSQTSEAMEVDPKPSTSVPSTSQQPMEVEERIETPGHRASNEGRGQSRGNQQQDFVETIRQMNIPGVQVFVPGDFNELSPQEQEIARRLAAYYMPQMGLHPSPNRQAAGGSKPKRGRPQEAVQFAEFKFPEDTKGKDVYKNELSEVNREEYKPCDRQAVLFNAEEVIQSTASNEDLPDEFFEITENDIRKMMVDLQKKAQSEMEQPLLTRSMVQERLESQYSKYQHVVIRIQFPDKVVLQGLFRPKETVHALHKFVKEYLEDKSQGFYLYTAPPKQVLKDQTLNLIQAKLAPASVVYFGSETTKDHYLSEAVMKEISPKSKAEDIVEKRQVFVRKYFEKKILWSPLLVRKSQKLLLLVLKANRSCTGRRADIQ
ncbi:tether containing UBX domain for GLUT4-like [Saccostrea echinata]|uniref:tether containing UBX domain for GLUT4-like n=1 Tax=Saccostrea echinata TaxID=191078 RepID=UPI002A7F9A05|nr:tether containing UBX domain for GLUT4-like [Saccostrea echinata]